MAALSQIISTVIILSLQVGDLDSPSPIYAAQFTLDLSFVLIWACESRGNLPLLHISIKLMEILIPVFSLLPVLCQAVFIHSQPITCSVGLF